MKKYFLHNGTESLGPFNWEELKTLEITTTTPVWFEGMEKWKYAKDIEELQPLLVAIPPPFQIETVLPLKSKKSKTFIFDLSKNTFLVIGLFIIFVVSKIIFDTLQNNRSQELEAKNKKTEIENNRFLSQQKEIEEQKIIATERIKEDKKKAIINRLFTIENEKVIIKENLDIANEKLIETNDFKSFKTIAEKNDAIKAIKNEIATLEKTIKDLEEESNQLNIALEKMKRP